MIIKALYNSLISVPSNLIPSLASSTDRINLPCRKNLLLIVSGVVVARHPWRFVTWWLIGAEIGNSSPTSPSLPFSWRYFSIFQHLGPSSLLSLDIIPIGPHLTSALFLIRVWQSYCYVKTPTNLTFLNNHAASSYSYLHRVSQPFLNNRCISAFATFRTELLHRPPSINRATLTFPWGPMCLLCARPESARRLL